MFSFIPFFSYLNLQEKKTMGRLCMVVPQGTRMLVFALLVGWRST
jgi:hypothetical protein